MGPPKLLDPLWDRILAPLRWKKKDPRTFVSSSEAGSTTDDGPDATDWDEATLVTSMLRPEQCSGPHWPVLDVDMPVHLHPSSTPGHFHLIIEKELEWDQYVKLLDTLAEVGIIEPGYAHVSKKRGYTTIRRPGITKEIM